MQRWLPLFVSVVLHTAVGWIALSVDVQPATRSVTTIELTDRQLPQTPRSDPPETVEPAAEKPEVAVPPRRVQPPPRKQTRKRPRVAQDEPEIRAGRGRSN